jgi:hypothetical protein
MPYNIDMIHAELDLPSDVYKDIERIAKASKRQPGQIMRDLITHAIKEKRRPTPRGLGALADLGIKGPSDLSSRLDDYLYGDE